MKINREARVGEAIEYEDTSVVIFGNIRESSFVDGGSSENRPPLNPVSRVSGDKLAS